MPPISQLAELLRTMQPALNPGTYAFCVVPENADTASLRPLGTFREAEGTTVIVEEAAAIAHGLTPLFRAAWITLTVHSDLAAVRSAWCSSRTLVLTNAETNQGLVANPTTWKLVRLE